jgi:hypothetical protein
MEAEKMTWVRKGTKDQEGYKFYVMRRLRESGIDLEKPHVWEKQGEKRKAMWICRQ